MAAEQDTIQKIKMPEAPDNHGEYPWFVAMYNRKGISSCKGGLFRYSVLNKTIFPIKR